MNHSIEALFKPTNIAIIGASRKQESPGRSILRNLLKSDFHGQIFPVNPKAEEVMGIRCYSSVKDIKEKIDLAFIAIPRDAVVLAMEECAQRDIQAAIVISAGFKEVDEEGAELEDELTSIAKKHGMAVLGPNCLGVINTDREVKLNGTFAQHNSAEGNISFISQSGAVGVYALEFAAQSQVSFAKFASLGNKAVSNENDLLEAYMEDEQTKVIIAYLEDFKNAPKFFALAEKLRKQVPGKPLLVLKSGGSESGKRAAASHTGALTESDEVLDHLFDQYGIIRMPNLESLLNSAKAFSTEQIPRGNRLCIITNAGGPGIITTDAAEKVGLKVPPLSEELQKELSADMPATVSCDNPIDLVGDADESRYEKALKILIDSQEMDILLLLCTPQLMTDMEEIARTIGKYAEKAKQSGKMIVAVFADFAPESKVKDILIEKKVPYYQFGNHAVDACAAAVKYQKMKTKPKEESKQDFQIDKTQTEKLIRKGQKRENKFLTEPEAYKVFSDYGLKIADYDVAKNKEEAQKLAGSIGFPMVAKVVSEDVIHKSGNNGVVTHINNEEDLMQAYDNIHKGVNNIKPEADIKGILLQKMQKEGVELIIGARYNENYGHLLMFGLGGIFVELLKDVSFRRVPLDKQEAMDMIEGIRTKKILEGMRGRPAIDKEALADYLLRLSQLVKDFPQIKEIDINPVFGLQKGALIADARLIIRDSE
ncbi:acetate--CoA ligase family protein [Marivirga sp. S37H4]|uniref:Acetate--CoA ligase family protein n=1 Tax=Marivirga aurantiaca TaxID=2802615 RepID=A0A934WYN3_9BACT|nr:acetate--CoA ligase [Marivirga aurantiaca]MBK6265589.1 acetate--CoA ligase family protein [Marivirga aurantiaca]